MEKNESIVLSELIDQIPDFSNPLKITYTADRKQIIISGFGKFQTLTEAECEGTQLEAGDIMLADNNGDILGYIMLG